jgi:hypothetical protein
MPPPHIGPECVNAFPTDPSRRPIGPQTPCKQPNLPTRRPKQYARDLLIARGNLARLERFELSTRCFGSIRPPRCRSTAGPIRSLFSNRQDIRMYTSRCRPTRICRRGAQEGGGIAGRDRCRGKGEPGDSSKSDNSTLIEWRGNPWWFESPSRDSNGRGAPKASDGRAPRRPGTATDLPKNP